MSDSDMPNASRFADSGSASPPPGSIGVAASMTKMKKEEPEGKIDSSSSSSATVDRLQSKVARLTAMLEKERSRRSGAGTGSVPNTGRGTFDGRMTAGRKGGGSDSAAGTSKVGPALAALIAEEPHDDALFPNDVDDDGGESDGQENQRRNEPVQNESLPLQSIGTESQKPVSEETQRQTKKSAASSTSSVLAFGVEEASDDEEHHDLKSFSRNLGPPDGLWMDDGGASPLLPSGAVVEIEETETSAVGQNGMKFAARRDGHGNDGTGAASALVLSPSQNVEWAEDGGMAAEISPLETALLPSLDNGGGHPVRSRRRRRGRVRRVWGRPARFCSEAIRGRHTPSDLLRAIAVLGIFFVSCLVIDLLGRLFHRPSTESGTDPNDRSKKLRPSGLERIDRITACAERLSGSSDLFGKGTSPQIEAVDWFVLGPGRSVPAPAPEHCAWESLFGTMFALMVVRGALNVTEPSWHDEAFAVKSVEDVCRHFTKIGCNDDKTSITELHLADSGASGAIPDAIGGLRALQRLELYDNEGVGGHLPSTLGDMTDLQYLYLHGTSVVGNIPETLGKLVNLRELFLERTGLEGSMPEAICKLKGGKLLAVHADCGGDKPKVECRSPDCCDKCWKPKE